MKTLVYILGFSYSGSTLLAFLLNAHPEMATTGEIVGPPHFASGRGFLCSCGTDICQCPFYTELEARIHSPFFNLRCSRWGTRALSQPPHLHERIQHGSLRNATLENLRDRICRTIPWARTATERIIEVNSRFINAAYEILGAENLVDSSKVPMRLPLLRRIQNLQIRVIHLVRHPAGCVSSAVKYHDCTPSHAAALWRQNYLTCKRQLSRLPDEHWIKVVYEDLCSDPEETCRRICEFLGTDYDSAILEFRNTCHHIVGNRMRLNGDSTIRNDDRREDILSPAGTEAVRRITEATDWDSR